MKKIKKKLLNKIANIEKTKIKLYIGLLRNNYKE